MILVICNKFAIVSQLLKTWTIYFVQLNYTILHKHKPIESKAPLSLFNVEYLHLQFSILWPHSETGSAILFW